MRLISIIIFLSLTSYSAKSQQVAIDTLIGTEVILTAPSKESQIQSNLEYLSNIVNTKVILCDNVEKYSIDKTLTKLYFSYGHLTLLISKKVKRMFTANLESIFIHRQVCVTGTVVPYKNLFAIVITDPDQIKLTGY